jgi:hypothetical protein
VSIKSLKLVELLENVELWMISEKTSAFLKQKPEARGTMQAQIGQNKRVSIGEACGAAVTTLETWGLSVPY